MHCILSTCFWGHTTAQQKSRHVEEKLRVILPTTRKLALIDVKTRCLWKLTHGLVKGSLTKQLSHMQEYEMTN